jgi:hypothetical protein
MRISVYYEKWRIVSENIFFYIFEINIFSMYSSSVEIKVQK